MLMVVDTYKNPAMNRKNEYDKKVGAKLPQNDDNDVKNSV